MDNKSSILKKLNNTLFDKVVMSVVVFLFIAMFLVVMLQITLRSIGIYIGFRVIWTEEISRILLVLVTFFGSAAAIRKEEHIRIIVLKEKLSFRVKAIMNIVENILSIIIVLFVLHGAYNMIGATRHTPLGTMRQLRIAYIYFLILIALVVFLIYFLRWLPVRFREAKYLFSNKN